MKKVSITNVFFGNIKPVITTYEEATDNNQFICIKGKPVAIGKESRFVVKYDENRSISGLFVKGLTGGYKHISTGDNYHTPNAYTNIPAGTYVIDPDSIVPLTTKEPQISAQLMRENQSYRVDLSDIIKLERHFIEQENNIEL